VGCVAKIRSKPLWRLLSERYNGGRHDETVLVYPGGGYYYPARNWTASGPRCALPAQGYRK